jgi:hypothetical protein
VKKLIIFIFIVGLCGCVTTSTSIDVTLTVKDNQLNVQNTNIQCIGRCLGETDLNKVKCLSGCLTSIGKE